MGVDIIVGGLQNFSRRLPTISTVGEYVWQRSIIGLLHFLEDLVTARCRQDAAGVYPIWNALRSPHARASILDREGRDLPLKSLVVHPPRQRFSLLVEWSARTAQACFGLMLLWLHLILPSTSREQMGVMSFLKVRCRIDDLDKVRAAHILKESLERITQTHRNHPCHLGIIRTGKKTISERRMLNSLPAAHLLL